jgi:hypothetical protein
MTTNGMTKTTSIILTTIAFAASCADNHNRQNENKATADNLQSNQVVFTDTLDNSSQGTAIICDSIYKEEGYRIILITFDAEKKDETKSNSIFTLSKWTNGQSKIVYLDSIYNTVPEVHFIDYNNDKIKDILIQNYSDARSNWTYYLYLVDTVQDRLKKIKGFEEIKNPNYLPEYNLIDNMVMSGRDWTSFYKIQGDSVKDFNIVIYDDHNENGTYDRDYNRAIKKILTSKKNNR